MRELEFVIPQGTQDVGAFIKQKFADACVDPKDGKYTIAIDLTTFDSTLTWQHAYMRVHVRGKEYRCGGLEIVPIPENGTKRISLSDVQGVDPVFGAGTRLSPGEMVTIII